ncbi:PrgI family mobile element protein [Glycomyces tenuis]|uniref:PrgI family mobile element protein n=1 Tax=Glycomyces tenuis TaxID=58116 RepID=UPI0012DDD7B3|nr:PrgI family protein [Glycomyces tenuis]
MNTSNAAWVPADLDLPDKVLFGLTARQVALLAPVALVLLALWRGLVETAPIPVLAAVTAPVAAVAFALATVRKDGASLDRLIWCATATPRRPIAAGQAPEEVRRTLARLTGRAKRSGSAGTAAVHGPVRAIRDNGLVDLGSAGWAAGVDVGFVNFGLRSGTERAALTGAFARLLHSLDAHLQVCVSTRPVDLSRYLAGLEARRTALPAGPLAKAAAAHQAWLAGLVGAKSLLRREITVIARCPDADGAAWAAGQVEAFAAQIGVVAHRLDRAELTARVRYGIDPHGTPATTGRTT